MLGYRRRGQSFEARGPTTQRSIVNTMCKMRFQVFDCGEEATLKKKLLLKSDGVRLRMLDWPIQWPQTAGCGSVEGDLWRFVPSCSRNREQEQQAGGELKNQCTRLNSQL